MSQLRCDVVDFLPGTVNTRKGAALKTGQVPDLDGPPFIKRDTFEDIFAHAEVPTTSQRWVQFADMATSTPVISERPMECLVEWTPGIGASQVPLSNPDPFICLKPQKDLFEEGFSHSLQAVTTEFRKLREPKVAKLKGGYSSDASLVFQLWLKDIWVYAWECCLSQQEAIQLVKDYTSEHVQLEVEYYLGLAPIANSPFRD